MTPETPAGRMARFYVTSSDMTRSRIRFWSATMSLAILAGCLDLWINFTPDGQAFAQWLVDH